MSNILTDVGTRVGQELKADRLRITALENKDPVITLAGDVTGTGTMTNLGNVTITATIADDSHNHVIDNVDGLQTVLDGKAAFSHTHTLSQITDFPVAVSATELGYLDGVTSAIQTQLNGKASSTHSHAISDVTNLQTTLDGKASTSVATTSVNGLMSASDKTKLDGVATGANNYSHPTGDGNLHIPATGTTNNGKVLTAGATAGSLSWTTPVTTTVNNTLTSTSTTEALSAAQGKVLQDSKQATLVSGTNIKTINSVSLLGSGNLVVSQSLPNFHQRTEIFTSSTAFTVPVGVSSVRVYAVGKGGDGAASNLQNRAHGGGGGGMAYGDITVSSGDSLSISISSSVTTVSKSGITYFTANAGTNATSTSISSSGSGGTASIHASVLNGGAYTGSVGGLAGNNSSTEGLAGGGGCAGSPLGNGSQTSIIALGGSGIGGVLGSPDGGGSSCGYVGNDGAGAGAGGANITGLNFLQEVGGSPRSFENRFTDPLIKTATCAGGTFISTQKFENGQGDGGAGAGCIGISSLNMTGGRGGAFAGGGGISTGGTSASSGTAFGGNGGFLAGGGGCGIASSNASITCNATGGNGGYGGGGGGACCTQSIGTKTAGLGGSGCVVIMY